MAHGTKFSLRSRTVAWQRRLQEILDAVWSFFVLVFSAIGTELQQYGYLIAGKDSSGNKVTPYSQPPTVAFKQVQAPPTEHKPHNREYRFPRWLKTGAQLLGIIGAIVSAAFIVKQWSTQVQALHIDQRAWVSAEISEKGGNFYLGMHNSGKTPALNAAAVNAFSNGKPGVIPEIDLSRDSSTPIYTGNLPPNIIDEMRKEGLIPEHPQTGYVIAPNKTEIESYFGGHLSQIFGISPGAPGQRMYIQGKIKYTDVFGETHETLYCYWVGSDTEFPMCSDHNHMD